MKLQPDDPRITNYLLGECTSAERLEMEHYLREDPLLKKELEALQSLTQDLSKALKEEPVEGLKPDQIMAIERHIQSRRKIIHWNFKEEGIPWGLGIAIAASLVIGWVTIDRLTTSSGGPASSSLASNTTVEIPLVLAPSMNAEAPTAASASGPEEPIIAPSISGAALTMGEASSSIGDEFLYLPSSKTEVASLQESPLAKMAIRGKLKTETVTSIDALSFRATPAEGELAKTKSPLPFGFLSPLSHELASVALETRSRSYEAIQKSIQAGTLPSPEVVQIDSLINAFKVNDATPVSREPFKVHIQLTTCPWNPKNALARIALVAQKGPSETPGPLARQVEWHFQLNPTRVEAYRILGYDDAPGKTLATIPSEQVIPLNFQRVVLIEIIPNEKTKNASETAEWLAVQVNYQSIEGEKIQRSVALQGTIENLNQSSPDLQFAAATAQFGALLKKLPNTEKATWNSTLELARNGVGEDPEGERHQFVALVEKAKRLAAAK
jgi:hypothetical protein